MGLLAVSFPKTFMVSAVLVAVIAYLFPQTVPERISRAVIRFVEYSGLLSIIFIAFIHPFFFHPLRHLPGPKSWNFIWANGPAQFSKPPGQEMLNWVQDIPNDGLLKFRGFLNQIRLVPTSPEMLKSVLADNSYDFEKPKSLRKFLTKILGAGLVLTEGDVHKFQRKNILPSFQLKHVKELYPVFWNKARDLVEGIEQDIKEQSLDNKIAVIEFGEWATRVTLDIIGVAGMGRDFNVLKSPGDELVEAYNRLLDPAISKAIYFAANLLGPQDLIQKIPWYKENAVLRETTGMLKQACLGLVREKKEKLKIGSRPGDDILSLLVQTNNFNDEELVDQALTFMAAGHETTSSAMTWAVYLLAKHPTWARQLRTEVRSSLPSPKTTELPSVQEIEELRILNAICNETLRLYPTVPMTIRESIRDTHIGPHAVPKGTGILIVPWAINRSRELWGENSEAFMPERWLQPGTANTGGARSNYAQMTFLHGPRSCIGMGFAKAEFKCLLAVVAGRFDVTMADPEERVWPAGVITTKPVHGMHLRMEVVDGW